MNANNDASKILNELLSRLPELEWKISEAGAFISAKKIPKGLFRSQSDFSGTRAMAEIKMDIASLAQQNNARSTHYLTDKISRKINVLVALCQMYNRKKPATQNQPALGLNQLSTRQQWITALENKITTLETQRQALLVTIEEKSRRMHAVEIVLPLREALGELEKHLTLAQEMYQKAVS